MKNPDLLRPGTVLSYPYLWRRQHDTGESEGRKNRPVCVVVAIASNAGETHLMLLAISTKPPQSAGDAIEIPETERRRAGLNDAVRSWITICEYNYDIAERSFYLDPTQQILGRFSRPFVMQLAESLRPLLAAARGKVDRL